MDPHAHSETASAPREVIDRFCESALQRGLSWNTIKNYRSDLEEVLRWASLQVEKNLDWVEFIRHDLEDYRQYLRAHFRGVTANRKLAGLRAFLEWAALEILDESEPVPELRRVETPPVSWVRPRWLSQQEQNRLLEAVQSPGNEQNRATVILLLFTGIRTSELCDLKWKNIYITDKKGLLTIHRASAALDVELPLNRLVRQSLLELGYQHKKESADPILSGRSGALTRRWVEILTRQMGDRAGISDITPLTLRNTYIANMLRLGVNPVIISDLLGDRAMDLLRYYAPIEGEDLAAAVERMADRLGSDDELPPRFQ